MSKQSDRLSSSPTYSCFSYFLGPFLAFSYFFSENSYFYFLQWNAKTIFLIWKSQGCRREHHLCYSFWGPSGPQTPGLINFCRILVHFVYFTLCCNIKEQRDNMLCYITGTPIWMYGYTQSLLLFAIKILHFSYFSATFISLKLLLFSYFFIWSHLKACNHVFSCFNSGKQLSTHYLLPCAMKPPFLTLKRQSRLQQTTFINIFSLFFRENKTWCFERILCYAEDSHETSSLISLER